MKLTLKEAKSSPTSFSYRFTAGFCASISRNLSTFSLQIKTLNGDLKLLLHATQMISVKLIRGARKRLTCETNLSAGTVNHRRGFRAFSVIYCPVACDGLRIGRQMFEELLIKLFSWLSDGNHSLKLAREL